MRISTTDCYAHGTAESWNPRVLQFLDIGDWVGACGTLFHTRTAHPTLRIEDLFLLAKSVADVPFGKTHGDKTSYSLADREVRRQKRYLDWITNPASQERFKTAGRVLSLIRRFLEGDGFLEVATPALEAVYGGAEARPFTTNVWALGGQQMYLRVSPELYLKRYIVGGFPRVFTICQNFRNEGIDATHNPEFTMMEWYEAFSDYEDQMMRFERLTCHLVESVHGTLLIEYKGRPIDFRPPWPRLRLPELVERCFGLPANAIDRATVEERIVSSMGIAATSGRRSTDQLRTELAKASLGALLMQVIEEMLQKNDQLWNPCFLCDHPKDISPLTKVKRGNPDFVERFEPYIAGMEVGNAYSELTDPVEQCERFSAQKMQQANSGKGYEDHPLDIDFVHAVACGMPPTGGVGYGIDRILMILLGQESIRDVIPFPMRRSSCVQRPGTEEQVRE